MSTSAAAPNSARRSPADRASFRIAGARGSRTPRVCDDVLVACPDATDSGLPGRCRAGPGEATGPLRDGVSTMRAMTGSPALPDGSHRASSLGASGCSCGATSPRFRPAASGRTGASIWLWRPSAAWRHATPRSGCGSPDGGLDDSTGSSSERWFAIAPVRPFSSATSARNSPCPRAGGWASRRCYRMVHGDVREERRVMEVEAETAPDFFPIYLGSGEVDPGEMAWLHERRLRDIELADRILVPSEHIAGELVRHGTPRDRIAVVPYAADTRRFVPDPGKKHGTACTFLFAGGITQRKGIKYLLEAWRLVRRPGWRLQLLGALPADPGPLAPYRDEVEWLGRFPHAEVPARMASADVFVFPSLFEGSAVVTYEAMACGLPCIVTAEAGSVARHGRDGLIVPARDVVCPGRRDGTAGHRCRVSGGVLGVGPRPGRGL